jgi:DNA-binding MarR family transcriptional regulator
MPQIISRVDRSTPLRIFGFLLKDASRLNTKRFEQRAAAFGLTLAQSRSLLSLAKHEGISQAQLAEFADVEPMTLVRIIDRMESDGWLERRSDPSDRRARRLYLTAKGRPLVDVLWRLVDLTRREALAGIPKKHAELLIALLQKVRCNLDSLEPLAPAAAPPVPNGRGRAHVGSARNRRERTVSQP